MKTRTSRDWIPFWIDKWLFGSMRIEFNPEERAIWIDFLALASKDDGWIRANEDTPYPLKQLSGMLVVSEELLEKAIKKFIRKKKLIRVINRTLYITNWEKYAFTDRHKRRVMSDFPDIAPQGEDKIRKDKIRKDKTITIDINKEFEKLKEMWPRKEDMNKAKEKYLHLIMTKKIDPKRIMNAAIGYLRCEESKRTEKWYIKELKTFLYAGNQKRKIAPTFEQYEKYADPKYEIKAKL